jgi:hypothetical protein
MSENRIINKKEGYPTPYEYLIVCSKCKHRRWTIYIKGHLYYCHNCTARMREATKNEYDFERNRKKV